MKTCQRCDRSYADDEHYCLTCGNVLDAAPASELICTNCGTTNRAGFKFCEQCGATIPPVTKLPAAITTQDTFPSLTTNRHETRRTIANLKDLGALCDTSNPPPECVLTELLEPYLPNLTDYASVVQALWFDSGAADNPTARNYVFYFFKGDVDEQRRPDEILTFKVRFDDPFKVHNVSNYLGGMAFGAINAPALAHRHLWRPGLMSQEGKQEFATSLRSSPKKTETEEKKGFLSAASEVLADVVKKSTSAAAELWDMYGDMVTSRVLQVVNDIAKHGRPYIMADEKYKTLVDYSWKMLPLPIRLLGRERLKWDALLFGLRDKIFLIEGEDVRVHPNAKEQIAAALRSVLGPQASLDTHPKDRANTEVTPHAAAGRTTAQENTIQPPILTFPPTGGKDASPELLPPPRGRIKVGGISEGTAQPQEVKAPTTPAAGKGTHLKVRDILSHVSKEYFKHFEEMEENAFRVTTQLTELFEHETYFRFDICDDVLRFEIKHLVGFLDGQSTFDDLLNILQENDHSIGTTSYYVCLHPPHPSNGISYVSLQNNHSYLMKWESADIAEMINLQFMDLKNSGYFLFKCDPPIAPAIRVFGPDNPRSTDAKARADGNKTILEQVADTSEGIGMQPHAIAAPSTQEDASTVNTAPGQRDSSSDARNNTVRCANAVCSKELPADSVFCGYCGTKVVES